MNKENILQFLKELKDSYYLNEKIYMEGSCYRVFLMLKSFFPAAVPLYSQLEGHYVTLINGGYYDIGGEVSEDYVIQNDYEAVLDKIMLESAKIPRYGGLNSKYDKYVKAV